MTLFRLSLKTFFLRDALCAFFAPFVIGIIEDNTAFTHKKQVNRTEDFLL